MTGPRIGAQRPTHLLTPEGDFDFTEGDLAIELAEQFGLFLFDWQKWLVRWILAMTHDGRWACQTVILVVPRQNGKGAILECLELYWLVVGQIPKVIHTAHEVDTAQDHMARIEVLTDEDNLPPDCPKVFTYHSNGKERTVNLDENLVLQYRTRTKTTKRGSSPQKIVLDESQELEAAHIGALIPSLAAQSMSPDKLPQLIYTGSAPLEHSVYMHELIDRVLKDQPPRTLLAMWACEPDADMSDVDNWYLTNPSMGLLISEDWVRDAEYLVMDRADFGAERLGIRKRPITRVDQAVIPLEIWDALRDHNAPLPRRETVRVAVDTDPDRSRFFVCLAAERPDGLIHGEITKDLPGDVEGATMGEFESSLPAIQEAVRVAQAFGCRVICSATSGLEQAIEEAGGTADPMNNADQAAGLARLIDLCDGLAPRFRHRGEPTLRSSLEKAQTKPYGNGGKILQRMDGSIPMTALVMALARVGAEEPNGALTPMFAHSN